MKKKSMTMLLLLMFSLSVLLTGCGGGGGQAQQPQAGANEPEQKQADPKQEEPKPEGDNSWERVKEAGVIIVGLDDSYAPMGFHDPDTNELTGFDIEMANMIGEKLGVKFEFQAADWNGIIMSLQSGHFDVIISGMNMLPDRKEQVDFVPYGVAEQVIVVKSDYADADKIKTIDDLKGKTIGSQLGSTGSQAAMALGFEDSKDLLNYKQFPDATLDLQSGRIDAIITDSFTAVGIIETGDFKVVGEPLIDPTGDEDSAKIGIAVRKEDDALQAKLQEAVDELLADGSLKELSLKWIDRDITADL